MKSYSIEHGSETMKPNSLSNTSNFTTKFNSSNFIPPPVEQRAGREVGVTSTDPETSGQVGGGLRALSVLAAALFPPRQGAQAMMSSWVANTKHINIFLMIIIIMA